MQVIHEHIGRQLDDDEVPPVIIVVLDLHHLSGAHG
jgi:hypothetical protein